MKFSSTKDALLAKERYPTPCQEAAGLAVPLRQSRLTLRDTEQDLRDLAINWSLSYSRTVDLLVYLRTRLHNWEVAATYRQLDISASNCSMLQAFGAWIDEIPEVFFALNDAVATGARVEVPLPNRDALTESTLRRVLTAKFDKSLAASFLSVPGARANAKACAVEAPGRARSEFKMTVKAARRASRRSAQRSGRRERCAAVIACCQHVLPFLSSTLFPTSSKSGASSNSRVQQ